MRTRNILKRVRSWASLMLLLFLLAGCENILGPGEIEKDTMKGSQKVDSQAGERVLL